MQCVNVQIGNRHILKDVHVKRNLKRYITNVKGNANYKKQWDTILHPLRWLFQKKKKKKQSEGKKRASVGQDVEKMEALFNVCGRDV